MRLLKFSVSNFRSFNTEQSIEWRDDAKVSAIFGPNGSGKTNFFSAMIFFRDFIRLSTKYDGQAISIDTFALSSADNNETTFLAQIDNDTNIYEYSFSISNHKISKEYLKKHKKDSDSTFKTIFSRASISTGRYSNCGFTQKLLSQTRDNALLLTKAWENNNKEALAVFEWLDHFRPIAGAQPTDETSKLIMEQPGFKDKVLAFLKNADLYIQDISVNQVSILQELADSPSIIPELKKGIDRKGYNVLTTHFIYDDKSGAVIGTKPMSLGGQESNGTRRMFELAFPVIDSLENGNILCIDEFELFLHPQECDYIIGLFNNNKINQKRAQLIILTHATQVMNQLDRKDIYLFGKSNKEETIIGSIPGSIRQGDKLIEKKYLRGFFGSIPSIGETE